MTLHPPRIQSLQGSRGDPDIYMHADLAIKEQALKRTAPLQAGKPGRYKPGDSLLAFLENL
jgi:hypothetical protein